MLPIVSITNTKIFLSSYCRKLIEKVDGYRRTSFKNSFPRPHECRTRFPSPCPHFRLVLLARDRESSPVTSCSSINRWKTTAVAPAGYFSFRFAAGFVIDPWAFCNQWSRHPRRNANSIGNRGRWTRITKNFHAIANSFKCKFEASVATEYPLFPLPRVTIVNSLIERGSRGIVTYVEHGGFRWSVLWIRARLARYNACNSRRKFVETKIFERLMTRVRWTLGGLRAVSGRSCRAAIAKKVYSCRCTRAAISLRAEEATVFLINCSHAPCSASVSTSLFSNTPSQLAFLSTLR